MCVSLPNGLKENLVGISRVCTVEIDVARAIVNRCGGTERSNACILCLGLCCLDSYRWGQAVLQPGEDSVSAIDEQYPVLVRKARRSPSQKSTVPGAMRGADSPPTTVPPTANCTLNYLPDRTSAWSVQPSGPLVHTPV